MTYRRVLSQAAAGNRDSSASHIFAGYAIGRTTSRSWNGMLQSEPSPVQARLDEDDNIRILRRQSPWCRLLFGVREFSHALNFRS
jgi:hypothetical protein